MSDMNEYQLGFSGDQPSLHAGFLRSLGNMDEVEQLVCGAFDAFNEGRISNLLFLIENKDTQQATLAILQRGNMPEGARNLSIEEQAEMHRQTLIEEQIRIKAQRNWLACVHQDYGSKTIRNMISTVRRMKAKTAS